MPKGSQQTGSASSQKTDPTAEFLRPYFEGGVKEAARVAQDPTQYPNYAPPNPWTTQAYNDIYGVSQNLDPSQLSGVLPGYNAFGRGGAGPQQTLDNVVNYGVNSALNFANPIADYARQAAGGNLGQDQLAAVAQGKYTDASSNPYLRDMVNAALRPVSENYQTSTAPTLDARFSAGGRYGSGAADQAAGTARDAFARNLGEISTGMYGKEYQFERGQQDTAATAYDQARRAGLGLGMTGLGAAGGLVDQGLRTVSSAAASNADQQLRGLAGVTSAFPSIASSELLGPQAAIKAGDYFRGEQLAPYNQAIARAQDYMKLIGGAPSGTSSSTQPIFGNPLTSALSGATGVLGLGKELGLGSAASSLFGGGGAAATTAGLGALFPGAAASALPAYAAALPEVAAGASAFAPLAAGAAWIVCTELMRQGRMPKRHYLAGWPVFAAYPERGRRGYYLWAIPLVRHLRRKPDSLLSRAAGAAFRWRAENIAAHAGVPGARKLWRGRAVTAVLYPLCATLGWFVPRQDWAAIYRDEKPA